MKTKHTQGEWRYYLDQKASGSNKEFDNGWFMVESDKCNWMAKVQFWPNSDMPFEEAEANAKLIAAAPDLLETLTNIKELISLKKNNLSIQDCKEITFWINEQAEKATK